MLVNVIGTELENTVMKELIILVSYAEKNVEKENLMHTNNGRSKTTNKY